MLKVKDKYTRLTVMVKDSQGKQHVFDGSKNYSQRQLKLFFSHEMYKKYIEEVSKEKDIKAVPEEAPVVEEAKTIDFDSYKVAELREMYPDATGRSREELIESIKSL